MNLQHVFGIDMGTGSVKIYDRNSDSVIKESNMIAIRDRESVFAVGNEAYEISEKTPESIELITPMSAGRVQDVLMMEAVLHSLLRKYVRFAGYSPVLFFSVPLDMTELERRAYVSLAKKGRFRRSRIFFVEKPFADAFSMGISPVTAKGTMIVDLGAQSTEVSILSDGRVIISRTIDFGGESFDAAIVSGVKKKNGLDWALLMITDVISEHSILLSTACKAEKQLPYSVTDEHVYDMPGVMSRKKQLLPEIINAI